jgi:hypothetical protein
VLQPEGFNAHDVKGDKTVITKDDKAFEVGKIGFGNQVKRYSKSLRASNQQQDRDSNRVAIEYETKGHRVNCFDIISTLNTATLRTSLIEFDFIRGKLKVLAA